MSSSSIGCYLAAALLFILALLIVSYFISRVARFYIRGFLWYCSMLTNGIVGNIICPLAIFGDPAKATFASMRVLGWWTNIKVEVRGYDEVFNKQKTPCVVVCNHQSSLDVIVMAHAFPPYGTCMMKKSLAFVPFFNLTAWLCNAIFVDRFNRERAQQAIDQCINALTRKNLKLWVFPEGTRNRALDGLLPFKKGAFNIAVKAQIPIIPMVASSYKNFYSKVDAYFESDGEIIVQVMDPISTQGLTLDDVVDLSERVRDKMLAEYEKITEEVNERVAAKRASHSKQH